MVGVKGEIMDEVQCPRCGSRKVKRIEPYQEKDWLHQYYCLDECLRKSMDYRKHEETYFQFAPEDQVYSWPAVGVQYQCHADDVENTVMRGGTVKPEFI